MHIHLGFAKKFDRISNTCIANPWAYIIHTFCQLFIVHRCSFPFPWCAGVCTLTDLVSCIFHILIVLLSTPISIYSSTTILHILRLEQLISLIVEFPYRKFDHYIPKPQTRWLNSITYYFMALYIANLHDNDSLGIIREPRVGCSVLSVFFDKYYMF